MKPFLNILLILLSSQIVGQNYIIKIADMPPGNVDFQTAKNACCLTVEGPGNPEIMRFRITYFRDNFEDFLTSYSSNFTQDQKDVIKNMYYNQKLHIDNIRIKSNGQIMDLPPVSFRFCTYDAFNLVSLCGKKGGIISIAEIKNDPYLIVSENDGTVIEFTLSFNYQVDMELRSNSNQLSPKMIDVLKNLRIGQRINISNIKIQKEDKRIISANSLIFKIR